MSTCETCSRFLGDLDLPGVWVVLHNDRVRGVHREMTDAISRAKVLAERFISKDQRRSTYYVSTDGTHTIKVERYTVT